MLTIATFGLISNAYGPPNLVYLALLTVIKNVDSIAALFCQ